MPCSNAMITDVVSVRPDQTVSEALALFDKHNIRAVPVVDEQHKLVGLFSFHHLLHEILPVSVTMGEMKGLERLKHMNISLDHLSGMAPWVAKRLATVLPQKVEDVMFKDVATVHPETPLREGLRLLVQYGSPIPVVKDDDSNVLAGLISSQTTVTELLRIAAELEQGKEIEE